MTEDQTNDILFRAACGLSIEDIASGVGIDRDDLTAIMREDAELRGRYLDAAITGKADIPCDVLDRRFRRVTIENSAKGMDSNIVTEILSGIVTKLESDKDHPTSRMFTDYLQDPVTRILTLHPSEAVLVIK